VVTEGYGVASGRHAPQYPGGTIRAQAPYFEARGVDLSPYFPGTLNISIAPRRFVMRRPRHTLTDVTWWADVPAETFSFSPCRVIVAGNAFDGMIYYPHPETKPDHPQPATVLEVLSEFIEGLSLGASVELQLNPSEIEVQSVSV